MIITERFLVYLSLSLTDRIGTRSIERIRGWYRINITCRKLNKLKEYEMVLDYFQENTGRRRERSYFNLNDLEFLPEIIEGKTLKECLFEALDEWFFWFYGESIIGGFLLSKRPVFSIHPGFEQRFKEMYESAEKIVNQYIEDGKETTLKHFSECDWRPFLGEKYMEEVLLEKGYEKSQEYWVQRFFDHKNEAVKFELPEGFQFKTISEVKNVARLAEISRDFLGININEYEFRNMNGFDTYHEQLSLVAVNSEEEPVAFNHVRYDKKSKIATCVAVACDPEYRNKGISKALMSRQLKEAEKLGAELSTVLTLTPDQFPAPNRVYESVGFQLVELRYTWKKNEE